MVFATQVDPAPLHLDLTFFHVLNPDEVINNLANVSVKEVRGHPQKEGPDWRIF